jgi:ABC-type Na+ efflux pump permease subunit
MHSPTSIVAGKEMNEAFRDRRSLASSLLYGMMGPIIVGLLMFTRASTTEATEPKTLLALCSRFLLLSTFTGGMNIAMDTLAGERERRSLLPLLMNPLSKLQLIVGKWISISAFSVAALLLNFIGFAVIIGHVLPTRFAELARLPFIANLFLAMVPLAMLAAAAELAVSTTCRSVKEAHTWLAFLVFVPVGLGMFLAFHPPEYLWRVELCCACPRPAGATLQSDCWENAPSAPCIRFMHSFGYERVKPAPCHKQNPPAGRCALWKLSQ